VLGFGGNRGHRDGHRRGGRADDEVDLVVGDEAARVLHALGRVGRVVEDDDLELLAGDGGRPQLELVAIGMPRPEAGPVSGRLMPMVMSASAGRVTSRAAADATRVRMSFMVRVSSFELRVASNRQARAAPPWLRDVDGALSAAPCARRRRAGSPRH
jgi:hypothetical protein